MARMSTSEDTSALLANLEVGRETGRLTIESADGQICRVYVLMGKVFYAEGPAGEGEPALKDARSWPDVTLSFDQKARLPENQTMTALQTSAPEIAESPGTASSGRLQTLSDNRPLTIAMFAYLAAGLLFGIAMLLGIGAAIVGAALHVQDDWLLGALILLLVATGLVWLVLYVRYRFMFWGAAVEVQDGLVKADIPRVIDAWVWSMENPSWLSSYLPDTCPEGSVNVAWSSTRLASRSGKDPTVPNRVGNFPTTIFSRPSRL
jgi:hypothetical protein